MNAKQHEPNDERTLPTNPEAALDAFAAELTDAAYPIALKYGVSGSSVDLELEIWKKFTEMVRERGREVLRTPTASRVGGTPC
jgi:hypothetical protein